MTSLWQERSDDQDTCKCCRRGLWLVMCSYPSSLPTLSLSLSHTHTRTHTRTTHAHSGYVNTVTGESSWVLPQAVAAAPSASRGRSSSTSADRSSQWLRKEDGQDVWWVHKRTGKSVWTLPKEGH